jgi:hypothetical protein
MRYLGFVDAAPSGIGADGGIDVACCRSRSPSEDARQARRARWVAKPLWLGVTAPSPNIVFSLAGYSPDAIKWADTTKMALFQFDYSNGVEASNEPALLLLAGEMRGIERVSTMERLLRDACEGGPAAYRWRYSTP